MLPAQTVMHSPVFILSERPICRASSPVMHGHSLFIDSRKKRGIVPPDYFKQNSNNNSLDKLYYITVNFSIFFYNYFFSLTLTVLCDMLDIDIINQRGKII